MNNFTVATPYTRKTPSGAKLTGVQLSQPTSVQIAWPNISGGNAPVKQPFGASFLRRMFG